MEDTLLSLHNAITQCASTQFGIRQLLPVQQLVIYNILEALYPNKDCDYYTRQIIVLPTGTGKSVCFQIPAFLSEGVTLVVYPLTSLIHDQQRRMREAGLNVYTLIGGRSEFENETLRKVILSGAQCCILTNPESLEVERSLNLLLKAQVSLAVIDEAHCISKWGKSFRSSYLNLGRHLEKLNAKVMLACTATASDEIIQDIKTSLYLGKETYILRGHANRENITYSKLYCIDKDFALTQLLNLQKSYISVCNFQEMANREKSMHPVQIDFSKVDRPVIIFCRSRSQCSRLVLFLRDSLMEKEIYFYHAGLDNEEKEKVEKWFFDSNTGILVATCAYGMGVDKSNIRSVIHYDCPSDVENFLQESGRAGRDTKAAKSIVLTEFTLENVYKDQGISCRREFLLSALGVDLIYCSGCDLCLKRAPVLSPEINVVLDLVNRYPHCFTKKELSNFLALYFRKYRSEYSFTQQALFDLAIQCLLREGLIAKHILWRHKLVGNTRVIHTLNCIQTPQKIKTLRLRNTETQV